MMIKAFIAFLILIIVLYSVYNYTKSLDDDELEWFVTTVNKVLAVLMVAMVSVACIIMIF